MPRGDSSLYFFYETLYERKKTKNPKKLQNTKYKKKYSKDPVEDMYKKISF